MYIDNEWLETKSIYEEYLNLLPIKDKEKKLSKTKYTTFLVFQSGKMLCTSINEEISREHYYIFTDIINKCKDIIEEKLV